MIWDCKHQQDGVVLECPPDKNLVTEAELLADWTLFTLDNATPVESTEAVLLQNNNFISIPSLTAQQVTPTHVQSCAVAGSPPGSWRTCLPVWKTEVRWLSRIDQILFIWSFYVLANRDQCLSIIASHHLWCTIETLEKTVAHFPEPRQLLPAGTQCAGTRQPMAFAFSPHVVLHCLQLNTHTRTKIKVIKDDALQKEFALLYPPAL